MPKRVQLVTLKPFTYAARALRARAPFEASEQDAKVLVAARLAEYATAESKAPPAPIVAKPAPPPVVDDELTQLRADYAARAGKKPHTFWRAERLRKEIEALTAPPATPDEPAGA